LDATRAIIRCRDKKECGRTSTQDPRGYLFLHPPTLMAVHFSLEIRSVGVHSINWIPLKKAVDSQVTGGKFEKFNLDLASTTLLVPSKDNIHLNTVLSWVTTCIRQAVFIEKEILCSLVQAAH